MQKINVFWIAQSLVYLEPFLFYQPGDFWRFRGDFRKKKIMTKKKSKIFFFKFLEIAFFEHNLARFEEKNFFFKFQKKILKISHFEKSVISDTIFDF